VSDISLENSIRMLTSAEAWATHAGPDQFQPTGCRFHKLATLEFDRKRKSMSVIVRGTGAAAQNMLLVKGAAECVVERCSHMMLAGGAVKPLSEALRTALLASVDSMAEGALRCLALAQKVYLQNPLDTSSPAFRCCPASLIFFVLPAVRAG